MEETLGKRIAAHRKRLGLTQDALAEQLGVTAQAVSKWENDQSCPDITMLPKLAAIFSVSTDELLGREPQAQTVHQAEVVDDDHEEANESEGVHFQKGNWEVKWDSGRKDALTFAILVLLVGTLTLCSRLLNWDASFWGILWPSVLLVYGVRGLLRRFSFLSAGAVLIGANFLAENLGLWKLNIAGELLFPIIVVLLGISLLVDALRKPKKPHFSVKHHGKNVQGIHGSSKTKNDYTVDGEYFSCNLAFGDNTHMIELPRLSGGDISVSFGELTVDLSRCEEISDHCTIGAACSFGQLNLLVPRRFQVKPESNTAFASMTVNGTPDSLPVGTIYLDGNVSFGELQITYI